MHPLDSLVPQYQTALRRLSPQQRQAFDAFGLDFQMAVQALSLKLFLTGRAPHDLAHRLKVLGVVTISRGVMTLTPEWKRWKIVAESRAGESTYTVEALETLLTQVTP